MCGMWEEFEDTKEVNQNLYIKEEQTTQWPKEKVQKDKQRSTKHTYKSKDRVTRTVKFSKWWFQLYLKETLVQ